MVSSIREIQILVIDGCPHLRDALERVRAAVWATDVPAHIDVVYVAGALLAARLRFLGSPTVRVDGVDVEPGAAERTDFAIQCRVYSVDGHIDGAPPSDWIERALRR